MISVSAICVPADYTLPSNVPSFLEQLPDYLDIITPKLWIGSDQRKFFFDALRDQDPVEGITVVKFEALDPQHVLQRDWQDLDPVRSQARSHERSGWTWQGKLADLYLG